MLVYRWVQLQRDGSAEVPPQAQNQAKKVTQSMAPRHLAWLFLRDPEQLEKQEKQTLSLIRKTEQVEVVYRLAQQFVTLLKERSTALHLALGLPAERDQRSGHLCARIGERRFCFTRSIHPSLQQWTSRGENQ